MPHATMAGAADGADAVALVSCAMGVPVEVAASATEGGEADIGAGASAEVGAGATPTPAVRRSSPAADVARSLSRPPDVITMDRDMPCMSGEVAVARLRALGYRGIIVGVTGNALREDVDAFRASGCNDVVVKPPDVDRIVALCVAKGAGGAGAV